MLYSLTGTHGSGKSTILSELKNIGYNIIERKTSRSVLSDWNISLQDIYNDSELMIKFQNEILERKINDEKDYFESNEIWFTDRSYLDLLVYSALVLGHKNAHNEWLNDYYNKCISYQRKYKTVFYIEPLPFMSNDGVRSINPVYSKCYEYSLMCFLKTINHLNHKIIKFDSKENRTKKIISFL